MPSDHANGPRSPAGTRRLALLALLLAGCLDPIPDDTLTTPEPGSIRGTVTDYCGGAPLFGVDVTARPSDSPGAPAQQSATSDASGRFSLPGLVPGSWSLSLSRQGYQTLVVSQQVQSERQSEASFELSPQPATSGAPPKLDLLFVVDNSNSMEQEQKALAQAFPAFLDPLLLSDQFQLDLQVGVTTTDMGAGPYNLPSCETVGGDGGKLVTATGASCPAVQQPYITVRSLSGGVQTNVSGDLVSQAFACLAKVGTGGCGFEQPLAAAEAALDPKVNPGFVRPDAALAVVVVTDEDDCSAADTRLFDPNAGELGPLTSFRCFQQGVSCLCGGAPCKDGAAAGSRDGCKAGGGKLLLDVASFVKRIQAAKAGSGGKAGKVFFAVVTGPDAPVEVTRVAGSAALKPSCQSSSGFAVPAVRLRDVVRALSGDGNNLTGGMAESICTGDLKQPMANLAARLISTVFESPCR